jgi:hypothetical protein
MRRRRRAPVRGRLSATLAVLLALSGCGALTTTPPAPTVADFPGIAGLLSQQGVILDDIVSGDAGCDDRDVARTAIAFDASGLDQAVPTRIHVYIFRDDAALERLRPRLEDCIRAYATDPEAFEFVEVPPFVAAGPGPWTPRLAAALEAALREGAGG